MRELLANLTGYIKALREKAEMERDVYRTTQYPRSFEAGRTEARRMAEAQAAVTPKCKDGGCSLCSLGASIDHANPPGPVHGSWR